jgi:hypothetical protein
VYFSIFLTSLHQRSNSRHSTTTADANGVAKYATKSASGPQHMSTQLHLSTCPHNCTSAHVHTTAPQHMYTQLHLSTCTHNCTSAHVHTTTPQHMSTQLHLSTCPHNCTSAHVHTTAPQHMSTQLHPSLQVLTTVSLFQVLPTSSFRIAKVGYIFALAHNITSRRCWQIGDTAPRIHNLGTTDRGR